MIMRKNEMEPKARLDKLLQQWAVGIQPPPQEIQKFSLRLHESVQADLMRPLETALPPDRALRGRGSFPYSTAMASSLAIVACMLLAVGVTWLRFDEKSQVAQLAEATTSHSGIVNGDRASQQPLIATPFQKQRLLIEQLQSVYQEPLLGFAESRDNLVVAIDDRMLDANKVPGADTWLLIRLSVERKSQPGTVAAYGGGVVWQMDVALRDQQLFTTLEDENDSADLSVWSCVAEDGLVLVDTRFQLSTPVRLAGNESHLVRPGLRIQIAQSDDLVLWQYVEVMHRQG